jgi:hypothetical protein
LNGLFKETVEEQTPRTRRAAIEAEGEFLEMMIEL